MKRRIWIWGLLTGLIGSMFLVMLWITIIAMRSNRDSRLLELSREQDKAVSIALWRADSFLAPIVTKLASMPLESYTDEFSFGFPKATPVADEAFVRSRFHFPNSKKLVGKIALDGSSVNQVDSGFSPSSIEKIGSSNADWTTLYDQLPRELLPSRDELFAMNRGAASLSNQINANQLFVANGSATPNFSNDLRGRNTAVQNAQVQISQSQLVVEENLSQRGTRLGSKSPEDSQIATNNKIGLSKPLWFQDNLLIARAVQRESLAAIQGTELDWPQLREALTTQIQSLLPEAGFMPTTDVQSDENLLAALPVRIVVPAVVDDGFHWSPLMYAVAGGWAAMLFLSGGLLAISLSALRFADKRSSFVNSVTHELRTPLTTFKMYSELLSRGMVDDDARQSYLRTLCSESNRLCHLIDNVLTYARLEKGRGPQTKETKYVSQVLDRIAPRLAERAALDDMTLDVQLEASVSHESITVDIASLEQILFNLVDNASKYASLSNDKVIQLFVAKQIDHICFRVVDNGPGISRRQKAVLFRPFSKSSEEAACSKPGVGLGLALSARLAKQAAGQLNHLPTSSGCTMELLIPIGTPIQENAVKS